MNSNQDTHIDRLIRHEADRQRDGLELIPSENFTSASVREALGSILTNKYSEGYPGKRYYGGNEYIDQVEHTAIERAKALFGVPHANVQPYSGTPANMAVYFACVSPGGTVMGLDLPDGGHLSHGWNVTASGTFYRSKPYHVTSEGRIDMDEVERLAMEHKPALIWCGATAYPFFIDFARFSQIADRVGAILAADIAHIAGLVVAGAHPSPVAYAHIVTTTTHKTLRGPRGAMIMVTEKGIAHDPELGKKIDKAVFPGMQGGPHDNVTAAIAVSLHEAADPSFRAYGKAVVANAKRLSAALMRLGYRLVGGGTENHLILMDLTDALGVGGGIIAQTALSAAGITVNKNTIPQDGSTPFYPSGIRLGTPAVTTRGMDEDAMDTIASFMHEALSSVSDLRLPQDTALRRGFVSELESSLGTDPVLLRLRDKVRDFASRYPMP